MLVVFVCVVTLTSSVAQNNHSKRGKWWEAGYKHQTSDYCTLPLNNGHLWACVTSLSCRNAKGLGAVWEFMLLLKDTSACRLQRREIKLSTFITLEQLLQPLSSPSFSHNNFIKMPNSKTTHVIIFFTMGQFFICCLVAMFRTNALKKTD